MLHRKLNTLWQAALKLTAAEKSLKVATADISCTHLRMKTHSMAAVSKRMAQTLRQVGKAQESLKAGPVCGLWHPNTFGRLFSAAEASGQPQDSEAASH